MALAAQAQGARRVFLPAGNGPEASVAHGLQVMPCSHVRQLVEFLRGEGELAQAQPYQYVGAPPQGPDFADVMGQEEREAGAGSGGGRLPPCLAHRAAGGGQEHAGPPPALHFARYGLRRSAGDHEDLFGGRAARKRGAHR